MISPLRVLLIGLVLAAVTGHPAALAQTPPQRDIQTALAERLPRGWEVASLRIEATENRGSAVTPRILSRFVAELRLRETTYREAGRLDGILVLQPALTPGARRTLHGIATSVLYAGRWSTVVEVQGDPFAAAGRLRGEFLPPTLVEGTPEYAAVRDRAVAAMQQRVADERDRRARMAAIFGDPPRILREVPELAGAFIEPSRNRVTPFRLVFQSRDLEAGTFTAEMIWPVSGSVLSARGRIVENRLELAETGYVRNPRGRSPQFESYRGTIEPAGIRGLVCREPDLEQPCRPSDLRFTLSLPMTASETSAARQ
ncbi:hypothetical protein GXW77_12415 [Roseomonas alkaliterrae]|uniref:Uncharacterized protein n=1 Tax=Neoroseomonas alkaliterrae TaxID=1452450 RepID=A0A840XSE3_9PROT|nr:hypothetical protein [Neoroseomonas alkaliterrae]MBB5689589.1 hypothetical protein [Neoroseomonas alkaliterrae]MBR0676981.1 hypothetical protein [Neoroseomonas alkaliterrae]